MMNMIASTCVVIADSPYRTVQCGLVSVTSRVNTQLLIALINCSESILIMVALGVVLCFVKIFYCVSIRVTIAESCVLKTRLLYCLNLSNTHQRISLRYNMYRAFKENFSNLLLRILRGNLSQPIFELRLRFSNPMAVSKKFRETWQINVVSWYRLNRIS